MVVGKINHRLEMARKLGADKVYDVNNSSNFEPVSNLFMELNGRQSPNLIFVSNNNANSLAAACRSPIRMAR